MHLADCGTYYLESTYYVRGLKKTTNNLCGIKSAELNGKKQASLWAYLKGLDLVHIRVL